MTHPALSNSLTDLAFRIRAEHQAVAGAIKQTLTHAMAAGDLLLEAKAQLKHGQWLPWLKEHCGIPERTCSHYMRLARNRQAIEAESATVADLTVRGAVEFLAPPQAEEIPVYPPPPPRELEDGETEIPIDDVKFDRDLYPRSSFRPHVVDRYLEFLPQLPPIEINQHNVLIDGWHRLEAHKKAGSTTIRVVVTEVADRADHWKLAVRRNSRHGEQLPIDAERQAVGMKPPPDQRPESYAINPLDLTLVHIVQLKLWQIHTGIWLRPKALELPPDLTFDQWLAVGKILSELPIPDDEKAWQVSRRKRADAAQ